jgi:hypothetical protein
MKKATLLLNGLQFVRNHWKFSKIKAIFVLACVIHAYGTASAQKMFYENGSLYIGKASDTTYSNENEPFMLCKIENNRFAMFIGGKPVAEKQGRCEESGGNCIYYDVKDNIVGRYVPSENRYYLVTAEGSNVLKEGIYAILLDETAYNGGGTDVPVSGENSGISVKDGKKLLNKNFLSGQSAATRYIVNPDASLRYIVEEGFDPLAVGFFLFIY